MNGQLILRSDRGYAVSSDARLVNDLNVALIDTTPVPASIGSRVFATESISDADVGQIESAASNLQSLLASVIEQHGNASGDAGLRLVQESAAVAGALCASAAGSFFQRNVEFNVSPSRNVIPVSAGNVPDYVGHRTSLIAAEAFDNRETRSAVLYTMAYNYAVSRQDEFGETVWPTLTLPADQIGFGIVVNRLSVHRGVSHGVDGKVVEFGKIDLMRAEADHTVLHKQKTRIYPIVRAASADKFIDPALVAPVDYDNEGVIVRTAPLATGADVGLLGISQTDASLEGGMNNQTDTLDPAISVEKLYVKMTDAVSGNTDVFAFNVYSQPGANFVQAPQGLDKQRNLTLRTKAAVLNPTTKQVGGVAKSATALIDAGELTVVLELNATGQSNSEFGSVVVYGNKVSIVKVMDKDGNVLPATNAAVQDLKAIVATAQIVGYDLRAYRTNMNMRERGDFIDTSSFTQLYEVPLLSPCTAQRPQNSDGRLDTSDFEALVTHTRFRLKNDAVTSIFEACQRLEDHIYSGVGPEEIPSVLGAARFHVKPTFYAPAPMDVTTLVDSWASANRLNDLQAAIVNKVRDAAFRLFVESEYQAAASALGQTGPVTVIVATDPILHRYIMVSGDLRTLTEKFNIRVVSTLDVRMRGKMFVTFGVFDENRNQAPNLLNWGNLVWAPEVVMSASVPRGESMSRETIVQPRYLFVNHLPVAAMLEFTNVPDLFDKKLPINWREVV